MRALHSNYLKFSITLLFLLKGSNAFDKDMTFKVEPGDQTCFFEPGKAGQLMEVQYEVIDGHHGDLDISFKVLDPNGTILVNDYKKPHNAIIQEVNSTGEFKFCFDNSFSRMNPKTIFLYLHMERGDTDEDEAEVTVETENGEEKGVLEWTGMTAAGVPYYIEVKKISSSLTRVLKRVIKARHQLDVYAARKSRDSHVAYESTFVVDVWSAFQISFMLAVGMVQVYMVKQLFDRPGEHFRSFM